MEENKKIALLGSTGSIGTQALDVARTQGYKVTALVAGQDINTLYGQIKEFAPAIVGVADSKAAEELKQRLHSVQNPCRVLAGKDAARIITEEADADIVLNAVVGIAGLPATLAALNAGTDVALANKESIVTGGALVLEAAQKSGAKLLPVDSEHSAIFQCLQGMTEQKQLEKILLTASGGPFYGKTANELSSVTKEQALRHPNWDMGQKITIDSASMMNKGLELIEAMWLFSVAPQNIQVVVQRESIIHSMVQFVDGSVLGQLGVPDMRIPIQYALTWPNRLPGNAPKLDFAQLTGISFGVVDEDAFRCLPACRKAAEKGGLAACAANGAGEQAVALFLQDKIGFLDIGRLVEKCVDKDTYAGGYSVDDVYACDAMARAFVMENI